MSNSAFNGDISEAALAELNFTEAPVIKGPIPGPKAQAISKKSLEVESMARGAATFPFVYDSGKGTTVRDPDGNVAIDITAGVAVSSVGRCHPRVIAAMKAQMDSLMHATDGGSTIRTKLAEKVASVMPGDLRDNCITFFTQSGSGAVETALKFAKAATGRSQIVAFHGAYHGVWTGCGSLTTGENYHQGNTHIPDVIHAPSPYGYRCPFGSKTQEESEKVCAAYIEYLLNTPYTGADDVAAVIMEPTIGEGGYIPLSPWYIQQVYKAARKHGALFICDEVQAGAGRSGKMWVCEYAGVTPDIITWGKGMGGDVPMGGCTMKKEIALKVRPGCHPNTFAANGVSAAACMTNIDIMTENNRALLDRVAVVGKETVDYLWKLAETTPFIGDVRGRGLMIGVELVKDKLTKEPLDKAMLGAVVMKLLSKGVIMVPCGRYGNVFRIMPPLTVTRDLLKKGCDILAETLCEMKS